jgi:hypothetical protein
VRCWDQAVRAVAAIGMISPESTCSGYLTEATSCSSSTGPVDFDDRYSLRGGDAYLNAAAALCLLPGDQTEMSATCAPESVSRSLVCILTD